MKGLFYQLLISPLFLSKKFNLSPTNLYYHALNEYYYALYSDYKNSGNYIKAMHYAKLINNKYTTSRIRREKRRFYRKHVKTLVYRIYFHPSIIAYKNKELVDFIVSN